MAAKRLALSALGPALGIVSAFAAFKALDALCDSTSAIRIRIAELRETIQDARITYTVNRLTEEA